MSEPEWPEKLPSCRALPPGPTRSVWCFLPAGHAGAHQGARKKYVKQLGRFAEHDVLWSDSSNKVVERPSPAGQSVSHMLGPAPPKAWRNGLHKPKLPARACCPWCHAVADHQVGNTRQPEVGDFTVCLSCVNPMVYIPGFAQQLAIAPLNVEACSFEERMEVRRAQSVVREFKRAQG